MEFLKQQDQRLKPLEERTYRLKSPAINFFCPLCRTKRSLSMSYKLTLFNYIQIFFLTFFMSALIYPWAKERGILVFFIIWPLFEGGRRLLFKREIPCPHCGFDASWYKRDVKVARQKVQDFWHGREGENENLLHGDNAEQEGLPPVLGEA